jgi:CelD/BcsL family acetyltransferase involved in cellulose biosynthesis
VVGSGGMMHSGVNANDGTLAVETVTSERGFDELEPAWTALYEAGGTSPFQCFTWERAWWRHYDGQDDPAKRLEILVVRDGGRVTAIAPFFVERLRVAGVWPLTRIALIGRERSDYLDLLVDERSAAASLTAMAEHVRRRRNRFDILVMEDVPDYSPWLEMWLVGWP